MYLSTRTHNSARRSHICGRCDAKAACDKSTISLAHVQFSTTPDKPHPEQTPLIERKTDPHKSQYKARWQKLTILCGATVRSRSPRAALLPACAGPSSANRTRKSAAVLVCTRCRSTRSTTRTSAAAAAAPQTTTTSSKTSQTEARTPNRYRIRCGCFVANNSAAAAAAAAEHPTNHIRACNSIPDSFPPPVPYPNKRASDQCVGLRKCVA